MPFFGFPKKTTGKEEKILRNPELRIEIKNMNDEKIIFTKNSGLGEFVDFEGMIRFLKSRGEY